MKKLIILFIFFAGIYFVTSKGDTPYNYFTRLSDAFIHGRLYLTEGPKWLSELIPAGENKWYVVYPPMPAIILIPFVYLFGVTFPQQIFAYLVGAAIATTTYLTYLKKGQQVAIWASLLTGVGSIIWFLSSDGSVWFLGQLVACLFLSLAVYEGLNKKRSFVLGLLLGAAYLSRINTILSVPFFLFILFDKKHFIKQYFYFGLGLLPFLLFNALYNFARFGVFWDMGYFLLPKLLNETNAPWFAHGVMNPLYIPENIRTAFMTFPKRIDDFPYIIPSWYGLSIWITTPAFVYSLFAPFKKRLNQVAWFTVVIMFLFVAMHGGTGWAQFGYRFAVDFYPLLIFLTVEGATKKKLNRWNWILLAIGILINTWGVIFINKYNWVTF